MTLKLVLPQMTLFAARSLKLKNCPQYLLATGPVRVEVPDWQVSEDCAMVM